METDYSIRKQVDPGSAYYTLRWSRLTKTDLHEIRIAVPARSGIYELYYLDENRRLVLMDISPAWYGGVRAKLRAAADPELETDERKKRILGTFDCYFRYSLADSSDDIYDVLHFLTNRYFPGYEPEHHSGRYLRIFVNEVSPDKITDIITESGEDA